MYTLDPRVGSKLEKTERQVSTGLRVDWIFRDFLFSFSQLVSILTLTE